MTAEGWNGKSIRDHVEAAESEAALAVEIAEGVEARLDELISQVSPSTPNGHTDATPIPATGTAVMAADQPALWRKVELVREAITSWQLFMMEARAVRQAIDEWRQLDTDTRAPRPGDSENE
jgi:hypothetical protein